MQPSMRLNVNHLSSLQKFYPIGMVSVDKLFGKYKSNINETFLHLCYFVMNLLHWLWMEVVCAGKGWFEHFYHSVVDNLRFLAWK